jgi:hypothetical protein
LTNGSSDPDGDTLTLSQSPEGPYPVGSTEVTLTVSDGSLSDQCSATVTITDSQVPTITCPTDQTVAAASSNGTVVTFAPIATDNCPPLITLCSPTSGSTFPLETTPVTRTATDDIGLQNSCNFNVTINGTTNHSFTGFFQPVDDPPTVNQVKAGQAIPPKFSLGGNYGLNIRTTGSPTSQQIACPSGGAVDDSEQVVTTSNSGLPYDAATDTYTVEDAESMGAGQCRQLLLTLSDGTVHPALFKLK